MITKGVIFNKILHILMLINKSLLKVQKTLLEQKYAFKIVGKKWAKNGSKKRPFCLNILYKEVQIEKDDSMYYFIASNFGSTRTG